MAQREFEYEYIGILRRFLAEALPIFGGVLVLEEEWRMVNEE